MRRKGKMPPALARYWRTHKRGTSSARRNPKRGGYDTICNRCYSYGREGLGKREASSEATHHMKMYPGHEVSILTPEIKARAAEYEAFKASGNPRGARSRKNPSRFETEARHISHGFYRISPREAGALVGGAKNLPRLGYEKKIEIDGRPYWLARTVVAGKQVWSVRSAGETDWGPFPLKIRNARTSSRKNPEGFVSAHQIKKALREGKTVLAKGRHLGSWYHITDARTDRYGLLEVKPAEGRLWIDPKEIKISNPRAGARRNPYTAAGLAEARRLGKAAGTRDAQSAPETGTEAIPRYIRADLKSADAYRKAYAQGYEVGWSGVWSRWHKVPRWTRPGGNPRQEEIYPEVVAVLARKDPRSPHHCDAKCKRAGHLFEHRFKRGNAVYGDASGRRLIIERRRKP